MRLDMLKAGQCAVIRRLTCTGELRRRLQELGFVPGKRVKCVLDSPFEDPKGFFVRGAVIALRKNQAKEIFVDKEGEAPCVLH